MNKNQVIESINKQFELNHKDSQVFDIEAEYDERISPEENFRILNEKIEPLVGLTLKDVKDSLNPDKVELQQVESESNYMKNTFSFMGLFDKPKVIGVVGDTNAGKSIAVYHILTELKKSGKFNLYSYGLRVNLGETKIYSIEELEKIKNSVIICDEFYTLFDLEDRKVKKMIEQSLRLINHNNNILVLVGLPENFKKFISAKANAVIFKRSTISDFINGSRVKTICLNYRGSELGSAVLNLNDDEALVFNGKHYLKINVPYNKQFDTKIDNIQIITPICENVGESVRNFVENK